ncbi:hypothetical protein AYO44_01585 [Planctomycetaceae bacterium SCGC AG-212-F19]|nr:hypothetical protein AYO44_01585 [Planctomycetaceae bacterium SCGC AG-212-F19]
MSDESTHCGASHTATADGLLDQMMRRVELLEAEKHYWKRLALGAITVAAVLLVGSVLGVIGASTVCYSAISRAAEADRRAQEEMNKARLEAQRAAVEEQRVQQIIEDLRARQAGEDRVAPQPDK